MGFADWVSVHYTKIWAGGAERNGGEFGIIPAEMNARLKTTLKAWPVVTAATVAVCYLTKTAAELCGIELPDQENITVVKQLVEHMFDSTRHFYACMRLFATVLFVMPAIEEFVFRYLLFRLPTRLMGDRPYGLRVAAAAPKPILMGRDLIALGYKPSPQFGKWLDACFEAQLDGVFSDHAGAIDYFRKIEREGLPPRE